ncbi:MAG: aminoacyl-histidine dipeptidase [Lachnospiraceae bacterium]|nr:aminoacyl-histidine dipeptidase [Lachnospiraceae bacterium]
MSVLSGIKPEKVFEFFEELCSIPHGSGNTREMSDHLKDFAVSRGLRVNQEPCGNIVIYKDATPGYEKSPSICLQGHMDMVCEKASDSRHNFKKDPLPIAVMDDEVFSRGTTLGADDGIAVAMILAILDSGEYEHPALEAVFTVDEETGMEGAKLLNYSSIKSRRVINLDSEDEGVCYISCAGGLRGNIDLPVDMKDHTGIEYDVVISGLHGGHSGELIDRYYANAIILMGRLLRFLQQRMKFRIIELSGGLMDNAIPREAGCHIQVSNENSTTFEQTIAEFEGIIQNEYRANEKNLMIYCENLGETTRRVLRNESAKRVMYLLTAVPDGVIKMCREKGQENLVQTSLNFGIMRLSDDRFNLEAGVRSSISSEKHALSGRLKVIAEAVGAEYTEKGNYPAWEYNEDSELLSMLIRLYESAYGESPVVKGIHAGLECGVIYNALKPVDIISFGPTIKRAHTPKETLSISSTGRTFKLLCDLLKELR